MKKITDTERLDFILKRFSIEDIGDPEVIPGVCIDFENLCEELTYGKSKSLCNFKDDLRDVIDRAIKEQG